MDKFPPYDPHAEGLGPFALSFSWILMVIAIAVTIARFVVRRKISGRWFSDDYIMGFALIMQIIYQIFFTLMFRAGAGRTFFNTLPEQRNEINKWTWIAITPGFLNLMAARISICIMLVRIFGTKQWFKWFTIVFTVLQTVGIWVVLIMVYLQVRPYRGYWMPELPAVRWNRDMYNWTAIALTFLSVICDLLFVALPVMIVWKLNMPMRRKLALIFLLGLSLLTAGSALAKITVSLIPMTGNDNLGHPSTKYFAGIINLCSNCEQMLVIILGCLPTLHVVTRMEFSFPSFKTLSSPFSSILSRSRRKGASEKQSSKYTDISLSGHDHRSIGKGDIELRPNGNMVYDDDSASTKRALSGPIIVGTNEHLSDDVEGRIHRTDSFTVVYKQQALPKDQV